MTDVDLLLPDATPDPDPEQSSDVSWTTEDGRQLDAVVTVTRWGYDVEPIDCEMTDDEREEAARRAVFWW